MRGIDGFDAGGFEQASEFATKLAVMGMVLEKGAPVLPTRSLSDLFGVFPNGAFVHHNLQLEEFAMYLLGSQGGFSRATYLMSSMVSRGMRGSRLLGVDFHF
jgi:hypothetical protein